MIILKFFFKKYIITIYKRRLARPQDAAYPGLFGDRGKRDRREGNAVRRGQEQRNRYVFHSGRVLMEERR